MSQEEAATPSTPVEGTLAAHGRRAAPIASYMNFLIVNGGVIVPAVRRRERRRWPCEQVQAMFPDREVRAASPHPRGSLRRRQHPLHHPAGARPQVGYRSLKRPAGPVCLVQAGPAPSAQHHGLRAQGVVAGGERGQGVGHLAGQGVADQHGAGVQVKAAHHHAMAVRDQVVRAAAFLGGAVGARRARPGRWCTIRRRGCRQLPGRARRGTARPSGRPPRGRTRGRPGRLPRCPRWQGPCRSARRAR